MTETPKTTTPTPSNTTPEAPTTQEPTINSLADLAKQFGSTAKEARKQEGEALDNKISAETTENPNQTEEISDKTSIEPESTETADKPIDKSSKEEEGTEAEDQEFNIGEDKVKLSTLKRAFEIEKLSHQRLQTAATLERDTKSLLQWMTEKPTHAMMDAVLAKFNGDQDKAMDFLTTDITEYFKQKAVRKNLLEQLPEEERKHLESLEKTQQEATKHKKELEETKARLQQIQDEKAVNAMEQQIFTSMNKYGLTPPKDDKDQRGIELMNKIISFGTACAEQNLPYTMDDIVRIIKQDEDKARKNIVKEESKKIVKFPQSKKEAHSTPEKGRVSDLPSTAEWERSFYRSKK